MGEADGKAWRRRCSAGSLGENPLPDAYKVTVDDLSRFEETVASLKNLPGVLSIQENSELAGKVMEMRQSVTAIAGIIIGMLLLVSLFIVSNTVRLTIFSRRLEISIMKDVGATDGFIRWPFMVEGWQSAFYPECCLLGPCGEFMRWRSRRSAVCSLLSE